MIEGFHTDERGASTLVIHIFALGILSLLLLILLFGASSYLNQQQELAAEDSLQTIGNQLASELTQVDRLSNRGANVSLTAEYPERIAGSSYVATVETGDACDTVTFTADSCVVLRSTRHDVTEKVPIDNTSWLHIEERGPGRFRLVALNRSASAGDQRTSRQATLIESNLQFGVGRDVERDSIGTGGAAGLNIPPTNLSVSVQPTYPQEGNDVTFRVEADDPDGPNDQMNYSVNVNSTRNDSYDLGAQQFPDIRGEDSRTLAANPGYAYENAGLYNVTLTVNDTLGNSRTEYQNVRISGLRFVGMSDSNNLGGGDRLRVTLVNFHNEPIRVHSLYFNPENPAIDEIDNGGTSDPELLIDDEDDGTYETELYLQFLNNIQRVPENGRFIENAVECCWYREELPDEAPQVDPGDTVVIELRGVRPVITGADTINMTVTYFAGDSLNTTQISSTP